MPTGRRGWSTGRRCAQIGRTTQAHRRGHSHRTQLKRLSVAQKHLVEIARALSHEAQVVIMDEPTAALSANEIDDLFRIIAQLKAEGRAIVFISHKFDEVFRIADDWYACGMAKGGGRLDRLRNGTQLVRMMVGGPSTRYSPNAMYRSAKPFFRSATCRTRPSSPMFPSTCARAKFSGFTASWAPAEPRRCRLFSASRRLREDDQTRGTADTVVRRRMPSPPESPTCPRIGKTRARSCLSASARM